MRMWTSSVGWGACLPWQRHCAFITGFGPPRKWLSQMLSWGRGLVALSPTAAPGTENTVQLASHPGAEQKDSPGLKKKRAGEEPLNRLTQRENKCVRGTFKAPPKPSSFLSTPCLPTVRGTTSDTYLYSYSTSLSLSLHIHVMGE